MNERFSFPEKDPEKRFLLGKLGNKNILCVGLNPSTADKDKTDPTSRNIEKIACEQGYDGWYLVNLYPTRSSDPWSLEREPNNNMIEQNILFIEDLINANSIKYIWLAWGNNIVARNYFNHCIIELSKVLKKYDLNILCIGTNDTKHPTHPSQQAINAKFKNGKKVELLNFDFEEYLDLKIR